MRIRRGNTVANAIKVLGDVIDRAQEPRNALGGLSSTGMTTLVNRPDYAQARDQYLNWVNLAQAMLGSVFADTDLSSGLMSRAYWHICNFDGDVRVLSRLIFEELVYQTGHPGITDDPAHSQGLGQSRRFRLWPHVTFWSRLRRQRPRRARARVPVRSQARSRRAAAWFP